MLRASSAGGLILDGEVIALRPDGSPLSFQVTMRRFGRKLEVEAMRGEVPLSVFFFDCLLRDDEPLTDRPASERFAALEACVPRETIIPRVVSADLAAAIEFENDAIARGHEGVMAKSLDAPYESGRRGAGWLKVKRANTLDLVVLAAEWGHGRRSGWLSNLHLGARDPRNGSFVMLGKTFKGLTDEMLGWQTAEFLKREVSRDGWTVYLQPGTGRRDRLQRNPGKLAVSGRPRPAVCASEGLSPRQAARGGRHDRDGEEALRRPGSRPAGGPRSAVSLVHSDGNTNRCLRFTFAATACSRRAAHRDGVVLTGVLACVGRGR